MKHARSLSILPTRNCAGLLFVLLAIWYAASSQSSAASYLLLFALIAVLIVSIPHTIRNLGRLKLTADSVRPTFAGQEVSLPIEIMNESAATRHGIEITLPGCDDCGERIDNILAGKAARLVLRFPAPARGEHEINQLCLTSAYPLGFVRALRPVSTSQRYVVYPKPAGHPNLPTDTAASSDGRPRSEYGEGDDFAGVRAYVPGESQRHIDWKAVARGQALMTKQFTVEADAMLYVDLAKARFGNLEERLSQLALWIIEAERARRPYGLRLPNATIQPALGQIHFHRCLRTLALFK